MNHVLHTLLNLGSAHQRHLAGITFLTSSCNWQEEDCAHQWEGSQFGSWNCYNNCSDVGVCRHGFCHCPAGRFGLDCSRTEAYAPRQHRPARGDLRVYVYDLPTSLALAETLDYGTRAPNTENYQVRCCVSAGGVSEQAAWMLLFVGHFEKKPEKGTLNGGGQPPFSITSNAPKSDLHLPGV